MWTWQRAFSLDCVAGIWIGKGKGVIKGGYAVEGHPLCSYKRLYSSFPFPFNCLSHMHLPSLDPRLLDSRGAIVELQWFKHHRKQTNQQSLDYSYIVLAMVAQISDSTMHQINHYSVGIFRENTCILRFMGRFIQWIALSTLWATGTWFVTKKLVSFCVIVFSFASGEEQSCELSLLCRTLQWPHK